MLELTQISFAWASYTGRQEFQGVLQPGDFLSDSLTVQQQIGNIVLPPKLRIRKNLVRIRLWGPVTLQFFSFFFIVNFSCFLKLFIQNLFC